MGRSKRNRRAGKVPRAAKDVWWVGHRYGDGCVAAEGNDGHKMRLSQSRGLKKHEPVQQRAERRDCFGEEAAARKCIAGGKMEERRLKESKHANAPKINTELFHVPEDSF